MQYITGACQELLMLPWLVDLETDPMDWDTDGDGLMDGEEEPRVSNGDKLIFFIGSFFSNV